MSRASIRLPTAEEDAQINRGIAMDPDNPERTDEDFARAVWVRDMTPEQLEAMAPPAAGKAELQRQGRANDALRKAVEM